MRSLYGATLVAAAVVAGCSRQAAQQTENSPAPAGTPFEHHSIGRGVTHGNLTVFPIVSKTARDDDRFITLDEGLAAGTVKIVEVGAAAGEDPFAEPTDEDDPFADSPRQDAAEPSGEVNRLMVVNTSGRPLYLMPGEVVSGGKQDRTIGEELVIEPGTKPVPIDVFCVEHARWSPRSAEETRQQLASLAANGDYDSPVAYPAASLVVPDAAANGRFVAPAGQAGKDLRLAIQQSQDQGKVWDEVQQLNATLGSESATGTFVAAYADADVNERLKPYLERLKPLGDTERIVGVAVCVNGKMRAADLFESTPLFRKFWPKLLRSYALDAIADGGSEKKAEPCTVERCAAFLKESAEAKPEVKTAEHGMHVRRESDDAISFSYQLNAEDVGGPAASAGAGMMGGFGGAVHSGAFAK